jgi:hypothetical protein
VLAALAVGGLTACQTHTGAAAFVGSTRISESEVNRYISPNAMATAQTDPTSGQVTTQNPKNQALGLIIAEKLFVAALKTAPGGYPSPGDLDSARTAVIGELAANEAQLTQELTAQGFTGVYETLLITVNAEYTILETRLSDDTNHSKLVAAINKLNIAIKVNPRYGTWDTASLGLSDAPVIPSFLTLEGTSAADGA